MSTDWRALAAELAVELERCRPLAEVPDCLARARAVLARYGHQPAPPVEGGVPLPTNADQAALMVILGEQWLSANAPERLRRPAPAAEGEVGELVAWLRLTGEGQPRLSDEGYARLTRAADLLSQRHPTPVPVSEHPWKRDRWCDDEDRCWCFNQWDLQWELEYYTTGAHWCDWMLPATALPVPQGEVQP